MDNQHQKISGYRDLTQDEIDLINEIKAEGERIQALLNKVGGYMQQKFQKAHLEDDFAEIHRMQRSNCSEWRSGAKHDLQSGIMKLTRAVAQPEGF